MAAGTATAEDGETQLTATTSGGTTVSGVWNSNTSTARYGVAVATGNGLTINNDGKVEVNVSQGNGISIDANGALQANEAVVAAGDNIAVFIQQ